MAVVLRVAPDLILQREVNVPIAAERDLKGVMSYEMDRLTPFRLDELYWTCQAAARTPSRDSLRVSLVMIPRIVLQPILNLLQRAGLAPTRIEAGGMTEPRLAIPVTGPPARALFGPRAELYALCGCAALAAVALVLPFALQSIAWSRIDAQIDAMKPKVALAEALRRKIASTSTTAEAIGLARVQAGVPLQIIALITDVLPDDTYLTTMGLRQHKVTIAGRSAAAARLIGAMAANPLIHNPAFAAPVTRDETNGGEIFSIRADWGS